jgi:hypothetical protein
MSTIVGRRLKTRLQIQEARDEARDIGGERHQSSLLRLETRLVIYQRIRIV